MKKPLLIAAVLALSTGVAFADTSSGDPLVIDPVSGETVLLSQIDTSLLTEEQLADLNAQLEALAVDGPDRVQDRTRVSEDEGDGEMHRYRYEVAQRTQSMFMTQSRQAGASAGGAASGSAGGSAGGSRGGRN